MISLSHLTSYLQKVSRAQKLLFLGVFLGFGCIGITFISQLYFADSGYNFIGKKDRQKLSIDKPLTQVFTAEENGLSLVKVNIGNLNLFPGEAIRFELRDASCMTTLASDSYTFFQSKPLIYARFGFDTIEDSKDKTYCAYIVYTSPYDRKSNDTPHINTNTFIGRSYTEVSKDKVRLDETLQMRPAYSSGNVFSDVWRLTERMSQYKPDFIKGAPLLILMAFVFFGSLLLSIWVILAKEKGSRE